MKKVIIIAGPTAVGKTKLSIDIAKHFNTEIISADSMQIYKWFDIGSAKVTEEEMDGVKHYLIDEIDPFDMYTVSDYKIDAEKRIDEIHAKGLIPVVTGGTGLYINALMYEMDFASNKGDDKLRDDLYNEAMEKGNEVLYERLKELDPDAAAELHPNNLRRVIRALEINITTGQNKGSFKYTPEPNQKYDFDLIILTRDREELYDRINQRVEIMMNEGLIEEVKALMDRGLSLEDNAMKGIGYKEVYDYLCGNIDKETMIETLKQNTRRYAKRQLTWFRRYKDAKWFDLSKYNDYNDIKSDIIYYIENK